MKKINSAAVILLPITLFFALIWLFPLFWMFLAAFKPQGTQVGVLSQLFSPYFTLDNFKYVLTTSQLSRWMFNSVFVTVVTVGILVVTTSLAAFALSRIPFAGSKTMYFLVLAGMMVPVEATIIPLYVMMVDLGLINSYQSLILPGLAPPLGVIIQKQFYDSMSGELMEAALIDGAGLLQIWSKIFFPLSRNAVVSFCIFAFVTSWNNFLWPFMAISNIKMMTMPVGVSMFQGSYMIDYTTPMAASALASIPIIVMFVFFQKQIINGIAFTGGKE